MDSILREALMRINNQIKALERAEETFGTLSANEKVLYSDLFRLLSTEGGSIEDKKARVFASDSWSDFAKGLAIAESNRNKERRVYELLLKAFDAEYLTFKIEHGAISREK